MSHLEGQLALVTGASRGIGRAIALRLARDGADVAVGYLLNEGAAQRVMDEITGMGRRAIPIQGDIRDSKEVARIVEEAALGLGDGAGPDIVVANAALGALKPTLEIRDSKWDLTLETCTRSFLAFARACAPRMEARGGGRLITLSSLGARRYLPRYAAIGTAKAALETLVRYLAVDMAPLGVRVNCVSGGPIETDALDYVMPEKEARQAVANETPLGRMGTPEDLANVVAFLTHPDSDWITGQTLVADGGLSLR